MVLTKDEKKQISKDLGQKLAEAKSVILVNFRGLKVKDMQGLRKKMAEQGINIKVVKNKLLEKALADQAIEINKEILDKPLACIFGFQDEVAPAKIVYEFSRTNEKIELLGAIVNKQYITSQEVVSLAKLPSREQLYAKIIGSLNSPICGVVNVLKGNLTGLVSVLKQYQKQVKSIK